MSENNSYRKRCLNLDDGIDGQRCHRFMILAKWLKSGDHKTMSLLLWRFPAHNTVMIVNPSCMGRNFLPITA